MIFKLLFLFQVRTEGIILMWFFIQTIGLISRQGKSIRAQENDKEAAKKCFWGREETNKLIVVVPKAASLTNEIGPSRILGNWLVYYSSEKHTYTISLVRFWQMQCLQTVKKIFDLFVGLKYVKSSLPLEVGLLSQVLIKRDDGPEKEAHNLAHSGLLCSAAASRTVKNARCCSNPQNLQSLTNDSGVFLLSMN